MNPLECPGCGGKLRLVAFVTHPNTIRHVLSQIGLPIEPPTLEAARDPPEQLNFTEVIYREDIDLLLVCDGPDDPFREIVDPPHRDEIDNPHIEEAYVEPDYQDFGAPDPSNWEPC